MDRCAAISDEPCCALRRSAGIATVIDVVFIPTGVVL
jgi:hypothetical protein